MSLEDLLNKLLFMAVCDDGMSCLPDHSLRTNALFQIPFSYHISS